MSMNSFDLGGGGNAFQFETPGDSVTGKITVIEEQQQTDMDSGQPAFWENGQPKMMVRVELQTELRNPVDPGDDGKRSVYLKGSKKPESKSSMAAAIEAVKSSTGARTLQVGGTFTLTYSGDGVASRRGYNAPKQYEATYQAPTVDLMGDQPAPQQQAATAPGQPQGAPAAQGQQPTTQPQQQPQGMPQMTPEMQAAFAAWQQQNGQPAA